MQRINRISPKLPVDRVVTYRISAPPSTHWRKATCREVRCVHHEMGWQTLVDERTDLGQRQAHYIRRMSGRSFVEERNTTGLTVFTFPPGQECFREHYVRLEREEVFSKVQGDFRGYLGSPRLLRPPDWVDDFAEHQEKLAHEQSKG